MKSFLAYLKALIFAFFVILPTAAFAKNAETAICKNTVLPAMNLTEEAARHVRIGTSVTYQGHTLYLNGTTLRTIWGACAELTSGIPAATAQPALTPAPAASKAREAKPAAPKAQHALAAPPRIAAPLPHVIARAPALPAPPRIMTMQQLADGQPITATAPKALPPKATVAAPIPATRALAAPMKPAHTAPAASPKENNELDYAVLQRTGRDYVAHLPWQQRLEEWFKRMSTDFTDAFASVIGFFKHWYVWGSILALLVIGAVAFFARGRTITPRRAVPPQAKTSGPRTFTIDDLPPGSFPPESTSSVMGMRDAHADSRGYEPVETPQDVRDAPRWGFTTRADDVPLTDFEREPAGGIH
ncbi:MAG TPA: hypothetical protein VGN56_02360 [Candidatus Paceibacterota bacterium]|jgi:hypothetical protein|nr:hypothetical protein [Candidatus Paceibacterota bacterium]